MERSDTTTSTPPDEVALTAKEQAQWMLHRLVPGRGVCNIAVAIGVDRPLRWFPLQEALNHLLRRHPALRTVLKPGGVVPAKRFLPDDEPFPLSTHEATEETLQARLTELVAAPFALDGSPLLRVHLLVLPTGSVLCLVLHHLVGDYVTATVLLNELPALYDGFATADQPPPALAGRGPVYFEPAPEPADVAYWVRHLDGFDPGGAALVGARPTGARPTFAGDELVRLLPDDVLAAVTRIQDRTRVTQNMVLLAAFYLMLARHGAGPDVVVGVPVSARRAAPPGVVGFHASTLPVRVGLDPDADVATLVEAVSGSFLRGLEHSGASFEAVQNELTVRSGDWRVPVFRHSFNNRSIGGRTSREIPPTMAGRRLFGVEVRHPVSRLDLEWVIWPFPGGVHITAAYSTEVHDRSFVDTLQDRYAALLLEMDAAFDRPLRTISGWSPADRAAPGPGAARSGPVGPAPTGSALERIRAVALARPDPPAIPDAGRAVSYRELVDAADAVRRRLLAHGVAAGEPVALLAARGPELAAAALGVWAAGAAYLPLDPRHPPAVRDGQLADAGVRLVLTDQPDGAPAGPDRRWLPLADLFQGPAAGPWPAPTPDATAYVIYTSGSTGAPKGVEVSQANLTNLLADFADRLAVGAGAGAGARVLWLTTFSFDISALELFLPLSRGGTVVVAPDQDRIDADRLLDLIAAEDVAVAQATPTTWRHLAGDLRGRLAGRVVLSGGEPLTATLAGQLLAGGARLFNVYGPTETTIWSTAVELTTVPGDEVPLGAPIANTTLHVLDPSGAELPPGVPGELGIGGAGVALGYRGQPELTAQRFIELAGAGRVYRTGDRVRWAGADLVYLGRLDRQVKVRGHRLELTAIESVLERHPAVRGAAVITEPDGTGHQRLVAAVRAEPAESATELPAVLREYLAGQLPAAAVPSRFVCLDSLPLTGNGKVDHRALAERLTRSAVAGDAPADPRLRSLVQLWRDVLGDNGLGPDADFFLHGGHSLLATTLAARVSTVVGVPVGFEAVFEAPSPAQLLARLRDRWPAEDLVPAGGPR